MDLSPFRTNNEENFELFSDIPEICKSEPCVLGVDEAGRGPVLGPMVYGICYCPIKKNDDLKDLGVDDSKTLTEDQREKLLDKVFENNDYLGWAVNVLSPSYISTSMYRRGKYNLNTMSHDTAIGLIAGALKRGVNVSEVYVDTVGSPEKYEEKLQMIFPSLRITVAKKADSLYPCVSAASICAKVARDRVLAEWTLSEAEMTDEKWGSGYPGDPVTKKFLQTTFHPVFGFPSIVRFSWKTAEKIIDEKGVKVSWEEEEPEEEEGAKIGNISRFLVVKSKKSSKIHPYFRERCLKPLSGL